MTRCPTIEAVYQEGYDAGFRAAKEQGSRSAEAKKDRALRQSFRDVLFEIDNACTNATEPRDGRYEAVREVVLRELFPGEALPAEPSKVMAAFERSMKDNAELLERLVASDTTDPEVIAMNERDPVTSEEKPFDAFEALERIGQIVNFSVRDSRGRLDDIIALLDSLPVRESAKVSQEPWCLCDETKREARRAVFEAAQKAFAAWQTQYELHSTMLELKRQLDMASHCAGGGQEGEKPCK